MTDTDKSAYFFEYPGADRYTNVAYDPKDKAISKLTPNGNNVVTKVDTRPGTVPSEPPWSTWNGRIHCSRDSWVGKAMLANPESGAIPLVFDKSDGKSINSVDAEGYSKGVKAYGKEDWINGKWFAPDWTKIHMGTGRTPDRKRVPDWVAKDRYSMPSVPVVREPVASVGS